MDSLSANPDILFSIASFLVPRDACNFLLTSPKLHIHMIGHREEVTEFLPSRFMNESLRHSLMSVVSRRGGFREIAMPLIRQLGVISNLYGKDQIAIAGSLIVQAITTGGGSDEDDKFTAGDIDVYCTGQVLPFARNLFAQLGLVLTKVSTSNYNYLQTAINHVESYAIPSNSDCVTTIENFIKKMPTKRLRLSMRRRLNFLTKKDSPYAVPPGFPFSPSSASRKEVDLVVTTAGTVKETIHNFDVTLCMSWFNGNRFFVPDLFQILQYNAKMRCPIWAELINAYASRFLSVFPLGSFTPISPFDPPNDKMDFILQCFTHIQSQGHLLPDEDGAFPSPDDAPPLTRRYCAIVHNMLVKQAQRIVKYNERGFHFVDITVVELNPDQGAPSYTEGSSGIKSVHQDHGTVKRRMSDIGDMVRRVKLLHNANLSSPIVRAKLRHLDVGGINTSPLFRLDD